MRSCSALIGAFVFVTACSLPKVPDAPKTRRAVSLPPDTEPGAPKIPWEKKTREQRSEYMGLYVLPKMKALFRSYDAKRFHTFRCQTCHGEDMTAVAFKMPNTLYGLNERDPLADARGHDEKMAEFMRLQVEPAMNELLGGKTARGADAASCFTCHPPAAE